MKVTFYTCITGKLRDDYIGRITQVITAPQEVVIFFLGLGKMYNLNLQMYHRGYIDFTTNYLILSE